MKVFIKILFLTICFLITIFEGKSQNNTTAENNITIAIPEVALLDLESENPSTIILTPISPAEAGEALDFKNAHDASVWVNYSSITGEGINSSREVTVVVEGVIPGGIKLKLSVSADNGNGGGKVGIPTNTIELSSQPQAIIRNIGSCYTGNGPAKGHLLIYSMELEGENSYALLNFDAQPTISVIYTLTENN